METRYWRRKNQFRLLLISGYPIPPPPRIIDARTLRARHMQTSPASASRANVSACFATLPQANVFFISHFSASTPDAATTAGSSLWLFDANTAISALAYHRPVGPATNGVRVSRTCRVTIPPCVCLASSPSISLGSKPDDSGFVLNAFPFLPQPPLFVNPPNSSLAFFVLRPYSRAPDTPRILEHTQRSATNLSFLLLTLTWLRWKSNRRDKLEGGRPGEEGWQGPEGNLLE
ncbi:hypothetical protein C8R44DRAFT_973370 [Mycena epipterygia]|nr:hypothetical protein C8R44DRAFT_973370 [Mycena epipterygia]